MQRYRDEILRPVVVPFIHCYHLMFQHDNTQHHVTRICTQFLQAGNVPVLLWPAYSPDMSPIEHVWDALDPGTLLKPLKRSGDNIPQATINNLINSMRRRCVRQMVVSPDTDWFSDWFSEPRPYFFFFFFFFFLKVSLTSRNISIFPVR
uniref:Tc1-like transposase DDE domain-containing protein n=1 Tax=Oncorhynchus tshawytscha TaxID=74940 RepID=A0AAZ3NY01_ONCTS